MVVEETSVQAPSVERQQEDIDHLIDWMSKEAHLPKVDDREWLLTVLHHNKYSLEKTKNKLENYFSYRNKYPEVLQNRDPSDKDIAQARLAFNTSSADRLTKDGGRVLFCRYESMTIIILYKQAHSINKLIAVDAWVIKTKSW